MEQNSVKRIPLAGQVRAQFAFILGSYKGMGSSSSISPFPHLLPLGSGLPGCEIPPKVLLHTGTRLGSFLLSAFLRGEAGTTYKVTGVLGRVLLYKMRSCFQGMILRLLHSFLQALCFP